MNRHMRLRAQLLFLAVTVLAVTAGRAAEDKRFSFAVAAASGDLKEDRVLRSALSRMAEANLAFVVAQGIKGSGEPCDDAVYLRRKAIFDDSQHGVVVSVGASDWAACRGDRSSTGASAKLTRVRELFFTDEFSLGRTRLPVVRQATEARFGLFVENARWEIGSVMFATVNLPLNNNHYVSAAGRNGEFEDRLVANREWLRRVFTYARLEKRDAVVLFSEANPLARSPRVRRDGFSETRRHLLALAQRFKGKVLIVHAQPATSRTAPSIRWRDNIGEIGVANGWLQLHVDPASKAVVSVVRRGDGGQ